MGSIFLSVEKFSSSASVYIMRNVLLTRTRQNWLIYDQCGVPARVKNRTYATYGIKLPRSTDAVFWDISAIL